MMKMIIINNLKINIYLRTNMNEYVENINSR